MTLPFLSTSDLSAVTHFDPDFFWRTTFLPTLPVPYLPITAHLAFLELCRPPPGPMTPGTIDTVAAAFWRADAGDEDVAGAAVCTDATMPAVAIIRLAPTANFLRLESMRLPSLGWELGLLVTRVGALVWGHWSERCSAAPRPVAARDAH